MAGSSDHLYSEQLRRDVEQEVLRRQHLSAVGHAMNAEVPGTAAPRTDAPRGSSSVSGISGQPLAPGMAAIDVSGPSRPPTTSYGGAQRLSPLSTTSAGTSDVEITGTQQRTSAKDTGPRKQGVKWCVEARRVFSVQVNCDKPYLAKFDKNMRLGEEWDKFARTISILPPFCDADGITGRACKAKYKDFLAAHRKEVASGAFTSGLRDGMDNATHDAINQCMQDEDEANKSAEKSKGDKAEYEAAKQDRAEKVLAFASRPSGSGQRKRRKSSAGSSPTSSAGLSSEEEPEGEQSKRRSKGQGAISVEDAVASYFVQATDSPETKERKLVVAETEAFAKKQQTAVLIDLAKAAVDSPNTKKTRLAVEKTNADARLKEVEARVDAQKSTEAFTLKMAAIMGKLAEKFG